MIEFNPYDLQSMCTLMDTYGGSEQMYFGENEKGEDITISIGSDQIVVCTLQDNGQTRKNVYWRNGATEELYDSF